MPAAASPSGSASGPPRSECNLCGKTFARPAHLERHMETHRGSPRSWSCSYCSSSYTRRHLTRCANGAVDARVLSQRVNQACQSCSERKLRCSRGQPCKRCEDQSLPCHYRLHGSAGRRPTPPPSPPEISMSISNDNNDHLETSSSSSHVGDAATFPGVGPAGSHQQRAPADINPWLSWEWADLSWNFLDSNPCMPSDISHEQITDVDLSSIVHVPLGGSPGTTSTARATAAAIIDAKVDPAEHHRQIIITYLQRFPAGQGENVHWLFQTRFPFLLKTYFTHHHRHTPIIHLPTFDIVACPPPLIFAISLIAASYIPQLGLRAQNIIGLAKCAYQFALEADEGLCSGSTASLETLQAIVLLGILDRLIVKRKPGTQYSIDLSEIARLGRAAGIFEVPNPHPGMSWRDWAAMESRRRLGLVVFAFDAFISVLHDETPNIRTDELNLRFPSPEYMFMAASEAKWKNVEQLHNQEMTAPWSVALTLSNLFCNFEGSIPLPNTLMGRFILLHGILQHAWRTKRVLLENADAMTIPEVEPYLRTKEIAVYSSLRKWRDGWPQTLLDFEPLPGSPALYQDQDRAEVCWYLAGVIMIPHVVLASPKLSMSGSGSATPARGVLSVQQILERLKTLSDQNRLLLFGFDFEATYKLVMEENTSGTGNGALGPLVYGESDIPMAGFAD
ncbi:hypothetical protein DL95DRAFT_498453 [Leptodontidium sp. 2 PMI_412]|nr:hypothetical protein DL95DRAFT_498453 [Leptodontidium sp. 2 PMI_412]